MKPQRSMALKCRCGHAFHGVAPCNAEVIRFSANRVCGCNGNRSIDVPTPMAPLPWSVPPPRRTPEAQTKYPGIW